jgi:hypothetical protein
VLPAVETAIAFLILATVVLRPLLGRTDEQT